jgi:hypothetical protein
MSDSSFRRGKAPARVPHCLEPLEGNARKKVDPSLRTIGARDLLDGLRSRVISTSEFRTTLEQIVRDPASFDQLIDEL